VVSILFLSDGFRHLASKTRGLSGLGSSGNFALPFSLKALARPAVELKFSPQPSDHRIELRIPVDAGGLMTVDFESTPAE
jgi:hypothetical protein